MKQTHINLDQPEVTERDGQLAEQSEMVSLFSELDYLIINGDVQMAVERGELKSG